MANPFKAIYRSIRGRIFQIIYPAQIYFKAGNAYFEQEHKNFYDSHLVNTTKTNIRNDLNNNIKNPYAMDLDAAIISTKQSNKYDPKKQYLIHCDGNATCYENLDSLCETYTSALTNVVLFNPPGVGHSPGKTNGPEDYQLALKSIVEHLHSQGIPYENIILSGRSLGAAISTVVAAEYQAQGNRIKVINDRSFARLSSASATFVQNLIPTTFLSTIVGGLLYYPVRGLIKFFDLEIETVKPFESINKINPGDAVCIAVEGDEIIAENESLYANLSQYDRSKYAACFASRDNTFKDKAHNLSLYDITSSSFTADNYLRNFLSKFTIQKTPKQLFAAKVHELIDNLYTVVSELLEIENSNLGKMSSSKINDLIDYLQCSSKDIQQLATELSALQNVLITKNDPMNVEREQFIKNISVVAKDINQILDNKQRELRLISNQPRKNMFTSHKVHVQVTHQQELDKIYSKVAALMRVKI